MFNASVPKSGSVIISPPGMDRIFLHDPGANNTFGAEDVNYQLVTETALFHFGYPPLMRGFYSDNGAELTTLAADDEAAIARAALDDELTRISRNGHDG